VLLNDSIADGHYQLGRALMRAGEKEEAKRELEKARELQQQRRSAEAERFLKKLPY
jgi:Flp pilus assembly protein TadD